MTPASPSSSAWTFWKARPKTKSLKSVINATRKDVKGGLSLTDAIAKHPNVFSKLYINMIRAAEIGGILDVILDRLAGFLEKEMEIRGKIKSAMMYPIIVLCFAGFMVVALFLFVLPRFKEIFVVHERGDAAGDAGAVRRRATGSQQYWWLVLIIGHRRRLSASSSTTRRPRATIILTS